MNKILPRLLPERARLEFHYPGDETTIAFVPFYENPDIKESQTANYSDYTPIGRAGSLYAYTGSQSRKFKVKGTYTLPHLAMHPYGIQRFLRTAFGTSAKAQRLLFTQRSDPTNIPGMGDESIAFDAKTLYRTLLEEELGFPLDSAPHILQLDLENIFGVTNIEDPLFGILGRTAEMTEYDKVIDTLLFFVAIFRTCTTNNAEDPIFGPPIVRLTFGSLYQSVPCICKSYNLSWEEKAGYDLTTLTPRQLQISLELEEVRSGDFTFFSPNKLATRNNLAGWESAIAEPYTTDPTNRAFD
jgi:hypothetical protein